MKRGEIKAGESYYYDRSNDWRTPKYGYGIRAVVVDDKRYRINQSTWGFRQTRYSEDPKGTAVLVDLYREGRDKPDRDVVPVAHLRGPWEATNAEVTAWCEERDAAAQAASDRADDLRERAKVAVERAEAFGVKTWARSNYGGKAPEIVLSVPEFERLLDRLGDSEPQS